MWNKFANHHLRERVGRPSRNENVYKMRRKEGNPNNTPQAIAEKKERKAALAAERAK